MESATENLNTYNAPATTNTQYLDTMLDIIEDAREVGVPSHVPQAPPARPELHRHRSFLLRDARRDASVAAIQVLWVCGRLS